jgi:hypothetical protein
LAKGEIAMNNLFQKCPSIEIPITICCPFDERLLVRIPGKRAVFVHGVYEIEVLSRNHEGEFSFYDIAYSLALFAVKNNWKHIHLDNERFFAMYDTNEIPVPWVVSRVKPNRLDPFRKNEALYIGEWLCR